MSRRFFDLAVATHRRSRSFSLRLAIIVDLVYVGAGAVGGAAVSRHLVSPPQAVAESRSPSCLAPGRRRDGSPPVIIDAWYHRRMLGTTLA